MYLKSDIKITISLKKFLYFHVGITDSPCGLFFGSSGSCLAFG